MKPTLAKLLHRLKPLLRNAWFGGVLLLAPAAAAQPTARRAPANPLNDYLGTYEYQRQYGTLQLLPRDSVLLAVIDEAEYPLRRLRRDLFLNGQGDTIPFRRDAAGAVAGFVERGTFYKRLSGTTAKAPASMYARRLPNGRRPRYTYQPPAAVAADGLPTASLVSVGLSPVPLRDMVQALIDERQYPGVHSVLIWHRGKLVLEEYFYGYDRQKLQQLRSASKSFVSALVGAAVQRGAIKSEQDRVLPYFKYPGYAHPDARKQDWTVLDFLTMRTGLDCNDNDGGKSAGNEEKMYPQPDWVKFVLDLPLTSDAGKQGSYCSGAVAVLGKAVENATGQPLPQFAEASLFKPLGIKHYQWNYRLDNTNPTVAQLYLAPRDFLKFGVLYLQKGQWQGQQVLPAAWVAKSFGKYSQLGSKPYGYLWWHQQFQVNGQTVEAHMASGNGGQKLYVLPALDAVVVFTGGNYNSERDTPPNELMPKYVLPALLAAKK
ncbi:serine hydrolase [Hymenobacter sp. BT683]|uniref:Serine hydrolase n=1 Tax=Hymenobacter jeongseonensis TaxID=2791027 RepID=A0ABS0ICW5_9BACT|nr:serine hydrolase domain-containing protein [Hymenobacter jeongseonensis]MBF9236193.1 serine hydrolase [Hymenobacter jeongseonensis]